MCKILRIAGDKIHNRGGITMPDRQRGIVRTQIMISKIGENKESNYIAPLNNNISCIEIVLRKTNEVITARVDTDRTWRLKERFIFLHNGYPSVCLPDTRQIPISQVLFGMPTIPGWVYHHLNGDRLDNRRCNIRLVTNKVNCILSRYKANPITDIPGVRKQGEGFIADIGPDRKRKWFKTFEAARQARRRYFLPIQSRVLCQTEEEEIILGKLIFL